MSPAGFPHSEILGSKSGYRLPEAYRRFPRPSSVPGAKASTVRPCKLEKATKMLASTVQFSTHDQANPRHTPTATHPHHKRTDGYGKHPGPQHNQRHPTNPPEKGDRPDPSGPNNVSAPPTSTTPAAFHTHPHGGRPYSPPRAHRHAATVHRCSTRAPAVGRTPTQREPGTPHHQDPNGPQQQTTP
jgi:hypothetical protein